MTTLNPSDAMSATLAERYTDVRARIARAAARSGRSGNDIVLVAVTKHAEPDQVRELITLGHVDLGENRVQQLVQRSSMIDEWLGRHKTMPNTPWPPPRRTPDPAAWRDEPASGGKAAAKPASFVRWHMIGHLQRNKARKAVEICRLIHSVDSLRLAEELQTIGVKRETPIEVLLQVNAAAEPQKYGCALPAAVHLAEQIGTMMNVRLRGVMCMAPVSDNPEDSRFSFTRARVAFEDIRASGVADHRFNILSMGMSTDFEVAIEEGANMVRVGTALFGEARHDADGDDEREEPDE